MIIGTGTDIVEVDRIKRSLLKSDGFREKVFSPAEVSYCEARGNAYECYAGRFAAKEAFFKALGTGWSGEMNFFEIVVTNDEAGKPDLMLKGEVLKVYKDKNATKIHLSLSHTKDYATAIVILEQ